MQTTRTLAGRYQLEEVLGRGGMAAVWRGLDTELGRAVAVKILELSATDPHRSAERFRREARTTAALSHPNIVTLFDTGVDADTAFLVMELLTGPTLAQRLDREGPLPVVDVISVARQVCAALDAAHTAGVVHRDIKPANLAYAGNGTVKVLDFGITRLLDATTQAQSLTAASTMLGTAAYLAPEQASGTPVDGRADLYSLGCVLTALLTGAPPFTGDLAVAVAAQHLHATPPSITAARPDTPAELAALIERLLAKDPAQRPGSAAEVAEKLAALPVETPTVPNTVAAFTTGGASTRMAPAHTAYLPVLEQPRRRLRWWWTIAAGVIAAAVLMLFLVRDPGPSGSPAGGAEVPATQPAPTTTVPTSAVQANLEPSDTATANSTLVTTTQEGARRPANGHQKHGHKG